MNKTILYSLCTLSLLTLFGCGGSGGGSGDSPIDNFKKVPKFSKEGGLQLQNGDYAKFAVASDDQTAVVQIELSVLGECYRVAGSIPVNLIDSGDAEGQFWQAGALKVQINPKENDDLKYNRQFVHFIVDRDEKAKVACGEAPKARVTNDEVRSKMQKTFFSQLPLSEQQLAMASPILARGSRTYMLFFKGHNMGLAFDSMTDELVGIDVPKQILETDFVFTSGREFLLTDKTPEDGLFPLMLTDEDINLHQRAVHIAKVIQGADEISKEKSQQDRDLSINAAWVKFFTKK